MTECSYLNVACFEHFMALKCYSYNGCAGVSYPSALLCYAMN